MDKYSYLTRVFPRTKEKSNSEAAKEIEEQLKSLGADGWELVSMVNVAAGGEGFELLAVFRRGLRLRGAASLFPR